MYKLVLIVMMMSAWGSVHLLQVEEEMAMQTLFLGKHAVNRAAHAAAQQLDPEALGEGVLRIAPGLAEEAAVRFLRGNLLIDSSGAPLPESFLRHPLEVLVFEVINAERTFPYTYRNDVYQYEVTLEQPGIVMIVHVVYPRAFRVLEPIEWNIKGAAELTAG
ncbi:hypothetical protein [Paenibacillus harenae]|uniref:hypothetical protein n=1 Tax=Paenibacillus harenae TaxID=306543 RepID=UPI0004013D79|nr:hypothetical protein [Paenibacillus harenae]